MYANFIITYITLYYGIQCYIKRTKNNANEKSMIIKNKTIEKLNQNELKKKIK